jgi:hypothetical protein
MSPNSNGEQTKPQLSKPPAELSNDQASASISHGKVISHRIYLIERQYPASDLVVFMLEIMSQRRTGKLTINFCDGSPLGTFGWEQRVGDGLDTVGDSIVNSA